MKNILISNETTIQAYGGFWEVFLHLKGQINTSNPGWSKTKLAALVMACFTIEAFANHVGQHLYKSWENIERGVAPVGKLKLFIEMLKIDLDYDKAPFKTVSDLMKWRNKVAHGKTEIHKSTQSITVHDKLLDQSHNSDWKSYVLKTNINKIENDCKLTMEIIHNKAFGNLEWFLLSFWQVRNTSINK